MPPPPLPSTYSLEYPTRPPSTTALSKRVFTQATAAAIPYIGSFATQTSRLIQDEPDWRWNYPSHVIRHVRVCAECTREGCLAVAQAGLDVLYHQLVLCTGKSGETQTLLVDALEVARSERRGRRPRPSASMNGDPEDVREERGEEGATHVTPQRQRRQQEEGCHFDTGCVRGAVTPHRTRGSDSQATTLGPPALTLPFQGQILHGDQVHRQVHRWLSKGVIEPDTAHAISGLTRQDLHLAESPWVFVVMGAGAAMGPLETLLSLGAHVIALDLPIPKVWERLLTVAAKSPGGSITFPMAPPSSLSLNNNNNTAPSTQIPSLASQAGCNLLTQIPQIIDWLTLQYPDKRLVLGSYAYLDSSAFVRVSLAMDAIASETLRERPNSALAYLCTPTDVFVIPQEAQDAARENYVAGQKRFSSLQTFLLKILPNERIFKQNVVEASRHRNSSIPMPIVDALIVQQGPNYFLAKRLQHWRAMLASASSIIVSSNVAPASFTRSVTKNALLKAGYAAAHYFSPIEIFEPGTSNVLMTYLLLHDLKVGVLQEQRKQQQPKEDDDAIGADSRAKHQHRHDHHRHPLQLFSTTSVHNGIWRCGYQIRSLLELAVLYYSLDRYRPQLLAGIMTVAGGAAAGLYATSRL